MRFIWVWLFLVVYVWVVFVVRLIVLLYTCDLVWCLVACCYVRYFAS